MAKLKNIELPSIRYEKIKSITLTALFSDDDLMEMLVLKGGNALNLIYQIAGRASIDLDFSIETKNQKEDQGLISAKIETTLYKTFKENKFEMFDYKFFERPKNPTDRNPEFWSGYRVEFKVIEDSLFDQYKNEINELRRRASIITNSQIKTFLIDISKYEFIGDKVKKDFAGLTIYVYSPEMICLEKLRAICQQMPEYLLAIKGSNTGGTSRARDFYDIYLIVDKLKIDLLTDFNIVLLKKIFEVKKVPTALLAKIIDTKDFHKQDYKSLEDSVLVGEKIKEFEFYFEYITTICSKLTSLLDRKVST